MKNMSRQSASVMVAFLGWTGIQRFMVCKIWTGIIWLCTGGVFFVGWIYDFAMIYKNKFTDKNGEIIKLYNPGEIDPDAERVSRMPVEAFDGILSGETFPSFEQDVVPMKKGELCLYVDDADATKSATRVVGMSRKSSGTSFRVMKGVSVHTGGGGSKVQRETFTTRTHGLLLITTQRVIWVASEGGFSVKLDAVVSAIGSRGSLMLQLKQKTYNFECETGDIFKAVFNKALEESE